MGKTTLDEWVNKAEYPSPSKTLGINRKIGDEAEWSVVTETGRLERLKRK